MASTKRKAVTEERPSKKAKSEERLEPYKERKATTKASKPKKASTETPHQRKAPVESVLLQEERSFPRGGAAVLTPLEQKQIKAKAERDALYEHETGQTQKDPDVDGDLFDEEHAAAPAKKKRKSTKKIEDSLHKPEGSGIKIRGLSYKNLVVGSIMLGRVTAITSKDVALALPNNLTGYVPITAVSQRLNLRIERILADDDDDNQTATAQEDREEDIDLKSLFHCGQWLRAVVTATGSSTSDSGARSKRHIELSLDPSQVNASLSADNVVTHSMIQGAVRSVEDHGVIMDIGLDDEGVGAFVSKKELGKTYTLDNIQEGQVLMGVVTGKSSNGKVVNLSTDPARCSATNVEKPSVLNDAPTVDGFLPGTAANVLVVESGPGGVTGKIMGMLDVSADLIHAGCSVDAEEVSRKIKVGSKIKARIIWALPRDDGSRSIGVSILDHTLGLTPHPPKLPQNATARARSLASDLDQRIPPSTIIKHSKIVRVMPERGLLIELTNPKTTGGPSIKGFAHISQISDQRVDSISSTSGPYTPETIHRSRVLSYNPVDNLYYVSLKKSTLDQAFLRLEDVHLGQIVQGTVEKLILGGPRGITGALVKLSDNVTALVPDMHFSDTQLQHPEKKFREGFPVTARVLSVDREKRQLRLTLKKSLLDVKDEKAVWRDFADLKPGMESKGTVINLMSNGAVIQFYGLVRAWLPVSEFSETYVEKPDQFYRLGQTISVRILSVDPTVQEMKVSAKEPTVLHQDEQDAWDRTSGGDIANGIVTEKNTDGVIIDLENGLRGIVRPGHLIDRSAAKAESAFKRIRVGQKMANLLILNKLPRSRTLLLSNKPLLLDDASGDKLLKKFVDIREGMKVHGFVRNITADAVYVEFANGLVGLVSKSQVLPEHVAEHDFGLRRDQTLGLWVIHVDVGRERFFLSMREPKNKSIDQGTQSAMTAVDDGLKNAVDSTISSSADFTLGKVTKARIASVKATQINVRLADGVQGRIDISEVFDAWEDISNKAAPLQRFQPNEVIVVKILGIHDARNHRFLPISHRQSKAPVFELSAKKSRIESSDEAFLTLDSVLPGSNALAFVNNHGDNCVWVNLSPNVRGRVSLMDLSDDVGSLQDVEKHFRIGRALRVRVKQIDLISQRLDLVARQDDQASVLTMNDISAGMILPARVTKVTERSVVVQLADNLVGTVPLIEMSDDYDSVNPAKYDKNDIVRVCVLDVDLPNKRIFLSLRPSRVLSSGLPVKDHPIANVTQVKPGDIVRGFVKHVAEKGVIISLSARVDARVWITDLSDQFIKDWQSIVQIDQLVKGRILSVDAASKEVRMSLKQSHVDAEYRPPLKIDDLRIGQIVTGTVRKVEDFGAFIDIDNTLPKLSGLCHKSEVAAQPVQDVRKLYSPGDAVKAKILKVEVEKRRISLGLKAKYFQTTGPGHESLKKLSSRTEDDESSEADTNDESDPQEILELNEGEGEGADIDAIDAEEAVLATSSGVLRTTGFDWTGNSMNSDADDHASGSDQEAVISKKRKRGKPEIQIDMTGDLDKYGPRSVDDFERQLLGQSNNSGLWIQYMAFQLQLGEVQQARDIAERALRTIHIRETEEKANVWIAWLNLEVEYGDEDRVETVFKEACQVQDSLEMHEKLASIYIDSGKHDKARIIFEQMVSNKSFRASPNVWFNYATFLMDTVHSVDNARALLPKALQSLPINEHRPLTAKFASLEFRSQYGDTERGRTIFEGLVSEWPNWHSGWDMWVDLERSQIARASLPELKQEAKKKVRALFERMADKKMKKRRAKFLFKKWLEFEEQEGDAKQVERVKALAKEYVDRHMTNAEETMDE